MKTQLSSIDLHYLIKELQVLIDGRIDKIYHPDKKVLLLRFHIPNIGKKAIKVLVGKQLYLSEEQKEYQEPSGFCMFLRKHLDNSRLRAVQQKESERIIEFLFEKKEGKEKLIIEFFGGGNVILCDDKDNIISYLEQHRFKDREIKKDVAYKYPKMEANVFELKTEDLAYLFEKSKKDSLVTCLAVELGLGGVYAEEICLLSNLDKSLMPSKLDKNQIKLVFDNIKKITSKKVNANISYDGGKVKDIAPFVLELYKNLDKKQFKTFNEAIDYYFLHEYEEPKEKTASEKEAEKLKKIIEKQEMQIKETEISAEEESKKAELIYNNYQLVNEILSEIKKARDKYSWSEIKEKLKGHKIIKEVDAKEKKIVVELE